MKMWIRMVVSHLFKLVEGPSCLISLARLTRRLLSSLKFLPPWSPSCPPPPSPPPASWWSGSSTCPPAPVGSPGLILGEVVLGECGHTWFAASGLFKLQQYQAASDTWLEARLGRGAQKYCHSLFIISRPYFSRIFLVHSSLIKMIILDHSLVISHQF